jgi:hypothetical protein
LSSVASAGAQLVGLAAGGLAVNALGPRHALLVSAGCHLVAAIGVRALLPRLAVPVRRAGSAVRQSWSATVTLFRDPVVRPLLLVQWLPPAFATGAEALIVPYTALRGFPAGAVGALMAAVPTGMLLADLAVGRLLRPATRERLVGPLILVLAAALIGLAAPVPFTVAAVLLALVGASFAYALGLQRRFLDAVPGHHRGQAFALLSTGLMTLQGVGPAVFGTMGQVASIPAALVTAGAATTLVPLLLLSLHRAPAPTPVSA